MTVAAVATAARPSNARRVRGCFTVSSPFSRGEGAAASVSGHRRRLRHHRRNPAAVVWVGEHVVYHLVFWNHPKACIRRLPRRRKGPREAAVETCPRSPAIFYPSYLVSLLFVNFPPRASPFIRQPRRPPSRAAPPKASVRPPAHRNQSPCAAAFAAWSGKRCGFRDVQ